MEMEVDAVSITPAQPNPIYDVLCRGPHGVLEEGWILPGTDIFHREDGPAVVEYFNDEQHRVSCKRWYQNGRLHCDDRPAWVWYFNNEQHLVWYEEWWQNGQLHREDGPAWVEYYNDEHHWVSCEYWYQNGQLYREDGPAEVWYFNDEHHRVKYEKWYQNGRLHREDGPAEVEYFNDEQHRPGVKCYYLNGGIFYTEAEYNVEMRRRHSIADSSHTGPHIDQDSAQTTTLTIHNEKSPTTSLLPDENAYSFLQTTVPSTCPICMCLLAAEEGVASFGNCAHQCCLECVTRIRINGGCPVCKKQTGDIKLIQQPNEITEFLYGNAPPDEGTMAKLREEITKAIRLQMKKLPKGTKQRSKMPKSIRIMRKKFADHIKELRARERAWEKAERRRKRSRAEFADTYNREWGHICDVFAQATLEELREYGERFAAGVRAYTRLVSDPPIPSPALVWNGYSRSELF